MDYRNLDIIGNDFVRKSAGDYMSLPSARSCVFGGLKGLGKFTFAEQLCREREIPFTAIQSALSIDAIRTLSRIASLRQKERLVVILDNADSAEEAAQNAFLKTLEEAPHLSFILIAHNPDALLPTILSRTVLFNFAPLTRLEMNLFLERQGVVNGDQKDVVGTYSGGRPGVAMHMIERFDAMRSVRADLKILFQKRGIDRIHFFHSRLLPFFQEDPDYFIDMCIFFANDARAEPGNRLNILNAFLKLKRTLDSRNSPVLQFEGCLARLA